MDAEAPPLPTAFPLRRGRAIELHAGGLGHPRSVRFGGAVFTPWEFITDKAAVALLATTGWQHPPKQEIPTGGDIVTRYLEPLAAAPALRRAARDSG